MHRAHKTFLLVILTSILLFPLLAQAAATKIGSFNQILGSVEHLKEGKPPGIVPKLNDGVARLDEINTQAQSRAELILLDNSVLTVAPGSHVTIEQYLYEGKTKRNIIVNLVQGFLDVVVTKASSEGEFLIKTPTAIMGIRGSWSKAGVSGSNALFAQMAGTGIVKGAGGSATLRGGMITAAVNNQLTSPTMMTQQNIAALNQASFTGLPRGMTITPNIQQTLGTLAKFKSAVTPPGAGKTMTKSEASLMNAGLEAKIQTLMKDTTLPPAIANAMIGTTINDSIQVALSMGANLQSAVTGATQAATQGALQAGLNPQQALSSITPLATQMAINLGMTASEANNAVSSGIQAAVQTMPTPMFSPASAPESPAPPAGTTGTGGIGGGGGGGGGGGNVASPSS
ncbi:MAG: FecR domain-containing protein [Desulfobaccales bacterium]